jgi:hypothetical protein
MIYNQRSSSKVAQTLAIIAFLAGFWGPRLAWAQEPAGAPAPEAAADAAPSGAVDHASADPSRPDPLLVRVTSSVESKYAAAMLRQVAKLFSSGFGRREADSIAHQIDVLPADQKQLWQYATVYKGVSYPLQIRARVDDFGMLDLDFYVPNPLAKPVRSAVDDFLNKHGA